MTLSEGCVTICLLPHCGRTEARWLLLSKLAMNESAPCVLVTLGWKVGRGGKLICSNKVTACHSGSQWSPKLWVWAGLPCHLDVPPPLSRGMVEIIAGNERISY